ncbi:MAG: hypothetical protein Wins2KO_16510 [Winogradskyella sp.]|uniref:hypothetical protein n=1 Tax=Winogradskyella sp. TaxID=1883156 RepID=UPI0025F62AC6|nr:hypothetical protein [Winogradskyella sp.]NRB59282.1 hypothetical protein [Winogradskyella sp.]
MTIDNLKSNVQWWESKRWIYNLLVGLIGIVAIYFAISEKPYDWKILDTLSVLFWGIGANLFYSFGTLIELFDWYYFNNKLSVKKLRLLFFILGTGFSCLYSFWFVMVTHFGANW